MAKKQKQKKKNEGQPAGENASNAWISFRHGIIIIGIVSIAMAALTVYQALPVKPLGEALLLGLGFGLSIWLVFFGFILLNRLLGRK